MCVFLKRQFEKTLEDAGQLCFQLQWPGLEGEALGNFTWLSGELIFKGVSVDLPSNALYLYICKQINISKIPLSLQCSCPTGKTESGSRCAWNFTLLREVMCVFQGCCFS